MIELSLRPYNGRLFVTNTVKGFQKAHKNIFNESAELTPANEGRFVGDRGKNDEWVYLVYASSTPILAHELSHVILHVFERCGIDPREAAGEPFCYMLSQLMLDSQQLDKNHKSR